MIDVPLFAIPKVAPLRKPRDAAPGKEKISYRKYELVARTQCRDCCILVDEALKAGCTGPPVRRAFEIRKQGTTVMYLCQEHADLRRDAEPGREKRQ